MLLEILLFIVLLFILSIYFGKPAGLPPGDWGWPIIGKLPKRGQSLFAFLTQLRKKYGDIFCIKVGSITLVVLCKYKDIKEAFGKLEFTGRPDFFTLKLSRDFKNSGYIMAHGYNWSQNRRFALSHLKDFGMGKSKMDEAILREVEWIINSFEKNLNEPFSIESSLNMAILNVTWGLVAGDQLDQNDKNLQAFGEGIHENQKINDGPVALLNIFPWMVTLFPEFILNKYMKVDKIREHTKKTQSFIKDVIKDHEKTLDIDCPRDLIDTYLIKMRTNDEPDIFTSDNLLHSIYDLFFAGQETTSSTLRWFVLYMIVNQDVQNRAYEEIKNAVPNNRYPSLADKDKLPYLMATIQETNRMASHAPFSLFHKSITDVQFNGYTLPKGTLIMGQPQMCHYDPEYWSNPNKFDPERFLDSDGKVTMPKEGYLPFSIGRRQCLGESIAKMELFLFTSTILQRFHLSSPVGETPSIDSDSSAQLFRFAKPFKVVLKKRD